MASGRDGRGRSAPSLQDLVPLLLAVALLVVGVAVGHIAAKDFWRAAGLIFVASSALGACCAIVLIEARRAASERLDDHFKQLGEVQTQQALALSAQQAQAVLDVRRSVFNALFAIEASGQGHQGHAIQVLTAERVAKIEEQADEIWIYSHNMSWDAERTPISLAVRANLFERKRYRYLVPDDPEVMERVVSFVCRMRDVPDLQNVLQMRKRPADELPFSRFGVTIYNPASRKPPSQNTHGDPRVILMPHFTSQEGGGCLIGLRPPYTADYESEYNRLWKESERLELTTFLAECEE